MYRGLGTGVRTKANSKYVVCWEIQRLRVSPHSYTETPKSTVRVAGTLHPLGPKTSKESPRWCRMHEGYCRLFDADMSFRKHTSTSSKHAARAVFVQAPAEGLRLSASWIRWYQRPSTLATHTNLAPSLGLGLG